jgi:hypothetical protein
LCEGCKSCVDATIVSDGINKYYDKISGRLFWCQFSQLV